MQLPRVLLAVSIALALASPAALADGDPASDTLIFHSLYAPVAQPISATPLAQLQAAIKAADASGFEVRVALILDRTDLGAYPQLLGHPVHYAKLLAYEDGFAWKDALVVVQPSGIAVGNIAPLAPAQRLVGTIPLTRPATSDSLAREATVAIRSLAAQSGHPITGSGRPWRWIVAGAGVALLLLGVAYAVVRRRARARAG
ncbi:MAG TPA: hypothetical protein VGF46_00835 [Gaiellales bacterium]